MARRSVCAILLIASVVILSTLVPGCSSFLLLRNASTIVGQFGISGSTAGGPLPSTLSNPAAVLIDAGGNLVIGDNEFIRVANATSLRTLFGEAGNFNSISGNLSTARLNQPSSLTEAGDGAIYFTEPQSNSIRFINAERNKVLSFVGSLNGTGGFADGVNETALFFSPSAIVYSPVDKCLYVADTINSALRKVTLRGVVTTAGNVGGAMHLTTDRRGMIYVLGRVQSGQNAIYKYNVSDGAAPTVLFICTNAYVAIGLDTVSMRMFAITTNRVFEILMSNGTSVFVAGVGTAYLDGPNPRFNNLVSITVESYRSIYLVSSASAYVIRRLAFDPPPPLPVSVVFPYPLIFPIDNATAMAQVNLLMSQIADRILGTTNNMSTLVAAGSVTFDNITRQTTFTLLVPNETFTNTSASRLANGNFTDVLGYLSWYYNISQVQSVFDPLVAPFLRTSDANHSMVMPAQSSTLGNFTALLLAAVRAALGYGYVFNDAPYLLSAASLSGETQSIWKYFVPPSFANASSNAVNLTAALAYVTSLYLPNVWVSLPMPDIPYDNATAMYQLRLRIVTAAETMLGVSPLGISTITRNGTNGSVAQLFIPTAYAQNVSNGSTQLAAASLAAATSFLAAYYPGTFNVSFDSTQFPWSDLAAVAAIVNLMTQELNQLLAGNANGTAVIVSPQPTVDLVNRLVTFPVYVPLAVQANNTNASTTSRKIAADAFPTVQSFIDAYYTISSAAYMKSFSSLLLPVFNQSAMDDLRIALSVDLATALNFQGVGVDSATPVQTYVANMVLGSGEMTTFPFLISSALVNGNTTAAIANMSLTNFNQVLSRFFISNVSMRFSADLLPIGNTTAMEMIRILLTSLVRAELNTTSPSVNVLPATVASASSLNGTTVGGNNNSVTGSFQNDVIFNVEIPTSLAAALSGNISNIIELLANLSARLGNGSSSNSLNNFLTSYYPQDIVLPLPFDLTPWSNSTAMTMLRPYLTKDILLALTGSANSLSPTVGFNATVFVSVGGRNVSIPVILPPQYGLPNSSATNAKLAASLLPNTMAFLLSYFPTTLALTLSLDAVPYSNATAMAIITQLLDLNLAKQLQFDNVGLNGSTVNITSNTISFKVIVPPSFDNATTRSILANASNITNISPAMKAFLDGYYPKDYFITFADGQLPVNNATQMKTLESLLLADLKDLFRFDNVGFKPLENVTSDQTGISYIRYPLWFPPSFANDTTLQLLTSPSLARVRAYLALLAVTPVPSTAAPVVGYESTWPVASLPTGNATQMELLRLALADDMKDALGEPIPVNAWTLSADGQSVVFTVNLTTALNSVTTVTTLQGYSYPKFKNLLGELTASNLVGVGGRNADGTVNEGCSRGCVIGVAAVGAGVVTAGVIGAVVVSSKRKRLTTVVAPKFTPVFDDSTAPPPQPGEAANQGGNKNPLSNDIP